MESLAIIVLAAGLGKRMRSEDPKVIAETCDGPMIHHVLESASALNPARLVVVTGHKRELVEGVVRRGADLGLYSMAPIQFALQNEQRGTGDAARAGLPSLEGFSGTVLILYGDVPLLRTETLTSLLATHNKSASPLTIVTVISERPNAYGRIIRDAKTSTVIRVTETRDCSPDELQIKELNSGIYAVDATLLRDVLGKITNKNAQGEYYLTDIVELAVASGKSVSTHTLNDLDEVQGVNDFADMALVNEAIRRRRNIALLQTGVRMEDPSSVYIDRSVTIEAGARIGPQVQLRGTTIIRRDAIIEGTAIVVNSLISEGAHIKLGVRIEDSTIGANAAVGPFAHIRPGSVLEEDVKIGNFVETKKAHLQRSAKASHLTYLGDCEVGVDANIGAGTITCNYDGYKKSKTIIGDGAFIGSNTSLVAPVSIGKGATVGAGSVITKDVEEDSLTLTRGALTAKTGWSKTKREKVKKSK